VPMERRLCTILSLRRRFVERGPVRHLLVHPEGLAQPCMVAAPGTPAAVCPGVPPILSMTSVPLPRPRLYLTPYGNQGGKHPLTASSGGATVRDWCKRESSARGLRAAAGRAAGSNERACGCAVNTCGRPGRF